jgi:reactive intermediate/imine deaminase
MKKTIKLLLSLLLINTVTSCTQSKKHKTIEYYNSPAQSTMNLPFSEAVRVGDLVFLAGQLGMDTNKGRLVKGGIKAETKQAMNNIKNTLKGMNLSMSDIIKCTVMLADIKEWQAFNEVYVTYFSKPFPTRSAFGASGLGFNARLEIECIAAINN